MDEWFDTQSSGRVNDQRSCNMQNLYALSSIEAYETF